MNGAHETAPTPETGTSTVDDAEGNARWYARVGASARLAAPAVAGYALMRLLGLIFLAWWASSSGADLWQLLGQRFDSTWYLSVAERGYDEVVPVGPDGRPRTTNLAFFPLYPTLIRLVGTVLPVSFPTAGLIISWTAGLVAAWGMFLVGDRVAGRRCGILVAVLWGVLPHALVQSLAYTETLFTALAAWSLYALLRCRWIAAGMLCCVAGLVRPTAVALMAAIGVAAALAVWRREDAWRPWLAVAIAPLGWLGFVGWVGHRLGRIDGWFYVQGDIWGSSFDGGRFTLRTVRALLIDRDGALVAYVVTLMLAISAVLLVFAITERQPLPLVVYSAAVLVLTAGGAGYFHSKARLLLPAFTLLIPAAAAMSRLAVRYQVAIVAPLVVASAWFGGHLAFVWPFSP